MSAGTARRLAPWVLLAGVVAVALMVGTMASGRPSTQADRVQHIASQLRCPVCQGETVADSNALISRDIRGVIQQRVAAGQPDGQIIAFVVQQYPGTQLSPPARGVGLIVWALPVLALAAAIGGLALAFARWRSRPTLHPTEADRALVQRALKP